MFRCLQAHFLTVIPFHIYIRIQRRLFLCRARHACIDRNVTSSPFAAPNARSILHSSLSPALPSPPAPSYNSNTGMTPLPLPSPVSASAAESLSPIHKTDITEPSLSRHSHSSAPASAKPTPPSLAPSAQKIGSDAASSEKLMSLESSLQLAALVASEHVQQQRPRSAFSPASGRTQLSSTAAKHVDSAAATAGVAGARAVSHPATGSRLHSGGAARFDTGHNRLNKSSKDKRSLVRQLLCAHSNVFAPSCLWKQLKSGTPSPFCAGFVQRRRQHHRSA